jgi:hypothetical protein
MSKKPYKSATQMDEELAEFTDRILSDQSVGEIDAVNDELRSLKDTVSRLKLAAKTPSSERTKQKIEEHLVNEWRKNPGLPEKKADAWQKFLPGSRPSQNRQQPRWVFASALVAIFLVIFWVFPLSQLIAPNLQATAGDNNQYQLVLFIVAAVLVVGLLWFGRNKS